MTHKRKANEQSSTVSHVDECSTLRRTVIRESNARNQKQQVAGIDATATRSVAGLKRRGWMEGGCQSRRERAKASSATLCNTKHAAATSFRLSLVHQPPCAARLLPHNCAAPACVRCSCAAGAREKTGKKESWSQSADLTQLAWSDLSTCRYLPLCAFICPSRRPLWCIFDVVGGGNGCCARGRDCTATTKKKKDRTSRSSDVVCHSGLRAAALSPLPLIAGCSPRWCRVQMQRMTIWS